MEESEYKSIYNELTSVRCVFEKALTNNQAKCSLSKHFCLADREGYSCKDAASSSNCGDLLEKLRKNSTFVLKLHDISGRLPHNMELRVQVGGVWGLAKLLSKGSDAELKECVSEHQIVDDICSVLNKAVSKFGSLDNLPYSEIIQSVVQFQVRRRRQR